MPLEMRNIAKGVTPRTHLPKPKTGRAPTKKTKGRKRIASDVESDANNDNVEPPAPVKKKRKRAKLVVPESEPEEVDTDDELPAPEEVTDEDNELTQTADEGKVSSKEIVMQKPDTHKVTGWA